MKSMEWKLFKKIIKARFRINKIIGKCDDFYYIVNMLLNNIHEYVVYNASLTHVVLFKDDMKARVILNLKEAKKIINKMTTSNKYTNYYNAILLESGYLQVFSENLHHAFKLRNIGHNSGYKYSRVYPQNKFLFPMVDIRGTERIFIPIEEGSENAIYFLFEKILSEIIHKNKKRALSLIENLEKLKY